MATTSKYELLSAERKRLQENNEAPSWMTTPAYQMLANKGYLLENETPRGMYHRLAKRAAELTPDIVNIKDFCSQTENFDNWYDAYFHDMWTGVLSPATSVLSNLGTNRGHVVACSGGVMGDSIKSFYETRKEIALLTQLGYGTSVSLDAIRPRGSKISKGGTANGVMQPMMGIVQDMKDISQGTRRGSCGQYLSILHPDFEEVCDQLIADDDGLNVGWNIGDDFIELLKTNPKRADKLWKRMLKVKAVKGKGYNHYIDKANRAQPQVVKDMGMKVKGSNLCVTGDTKILTRDGYVEIEKLAGTTVECWNGKEWSHTPLFSTGQSGEVSEVFLSNGLSIKATNYHKWYRAVQDRRGKLLRYEEVRTHELNIGDKLMKFDLEPVTHGTKELQYPYENGFLTGDGTVNTDGSKRISLYADKKDLVQFIEGGRSVTETPCTNKAGGTKVNIYFDKDVLEEKFFIPDASYSVGSRLKWLAGLLDADGTLTKNNMSETIQLVSVELDFIKGLYLMLQELGIQAKVVDGCPAGYRVLPLNGGSEESKEYWCKESKRLLIHGSELTKLVDLGYKAHRVQPSGRTQQREAKRFLKVVGIKDVEGVVDTYCGTEPKLNKLTFNGQVTGNCQEVELPSDENHTFTCVLSSINVSRYDTWKDTMVIERSAVFMDALITDTLDKIEKDGLEDDLHKLVRFMKGFRAIGMGTLGQSTYYQYKMWEFGDIQSQAFNMHIATIMDERTLWASKYLADKVGEPEYMVGYGERFSHRLMNPPTMSTGVIQGNPSAGIEPVFANVYVHDTAAGSIFMITPAFFDLIKDKGIYSEELMQRISDNGGSIQGFEEFTAEEQRVFRTAFEINQEVILQMASARQTKIDQGQSINLYFGKNADEEYISKLHFIALMDENILGLYYMRTTNADVLQNTECVACAS